MEKKIKITFVLPSLEAGGAERVISYISQNLNKDVFESDMIVVGFEKDNVFETGNTPVNYLNKSRVLHAFPVIFKILLNKRPDIIFSTISHLNVLMGLQAIFFSKTKFIGREANVKSVLKDYTQSQNKSSWLWRVFNKIGYKFLDKIVCQSNDMAHDMITNYHFPEKKIQVINNPISDILRVKKEIKPISENGFNCITVGRLVPQKGHLRILEALAKINRPFQYTIIGDGPEKQKIMEQARQLSIFKNITHIPYTNEVFKHLADNHLFLQGSYVEGFPNALLESCAIGTPVVAFKAPGGIDEIIINEENGFIVEDIEQFSKRIVEIIDELLLWKPEVVSQSVFEKYNSRKILSQYENMFFSITAEEQTSNPI